MSLDIIFVYLLQQKFICMKELKRKKKGKREKCRAVMHYFLTWFFAIIKNLVLPSIHISNSKNRQRMIKILFPKKKKEKSHLLIFFAVLFEIRIYFLKKSLRVYTKRPLNVRKLSKKEQSSFFSTSILPKSLQFQKEKVTKVLRILGNRNLKFSSRHVPTKKSFLDKVQLLQISKDKRKD